MYICISVVYKFAVNVMIIGGVFGIHFENKTKTYIEKTRLRAVVLFSSDLLASGNE